MKKLLKDKIIQLGKYMNTKSSFNVPIVKSIIACFEMALSETDIDRLLMVGEDEYDREGLKELWKLSDEEFEDYFPKIMEKGVLWPRHKEELFELAPIFPGWIEIYASGPVSEERNEFILKFSEFEELLKTLNIPPIRAYMNHVNATLMKNVPGRMSTLAVEGSKKVTINCKLTTEQSVNVAGELYPMLLKHREHLSVMNCFCRMMKNLKEKNCGFSMPVESCIAVGRMSDILVENGVSRKLDYDEAVEIMERLEKQGCIHTVYHYGIDSQEDEMMICNCCVDCCFLYSSYRRGSLSQLLIKAYYKPQEAEPSQCIGCNKCGRFCPTGATWYDKDNKKLIFNEEKCIGCGQCVSQCPRPVRTMVKDERNVFVKTRTKKEWETVR